MYSSFSNCGATPSFPFSGKPTPKQGIVEEIINSGLTDETIIDFIFTMVNSKFAEKPSDTRYTQHQELINKLAHQANAKLPIEYRLFHYQSGYPCKYYNQQEYQQNIIEIKQNIKTWLTQLKNSNSITSTVARVVQESGNRLGMASSLLIERAKRQYETIPETISPP